MQKAKNYKKIAKYAFQDKVNNVVLLMKFLDSIGGQEMVRNYFAEALPKYILEFEGFGGTKKWVVRQWLKASPQGFIHKVLDQIKADGEFLQEKFELLEDTKDRIVVKINCKYMRSLAKKSKKYECDFFSRDYYCQNACIPLLTQVTSDIYLGLTVELTKDGCIQTIAFDKSAFEKDEAINENEKIGE